MVKVADEKPEPLDQREAHEAIQRILGQPTHALTFTEHCRQRSRERNFSAEDVWRVLRFGSVGPIPEWDEMRQEWRYRVSGRDYDNDPLTVVVVIDVENDRLRLVTAHG